MSKGERAERCRWQIKRGERVAAVGKAQARTVGRSDCRVPQQGKSNNANDIVHLDGTQDIHKTKKALRREPFL